MKFHPKFVYPPTHSILIILFKMTVTNVTVCVLPTFMYKVIPGRLYNAYKMLVDILF